MFFSCGLLPKCPCLCKPRSETLFGIQRSIFLKYACIDPGDPQDRAPLQSSSQHLETTDISFSGVSNCKALHAHTTRVLVYKLKMSKDPCPACLF